MKDTGPKVIMMGPGITGVIHTGRWFRRLCAHALLDGVRVDVEGTKAPLRDARFSVKVYPPAEGQNAEMQAPKILKGKIDEVLNALSEAEYGARVLVKLVSELLNGVS